MYICTHTSTPGTTARQRPCKELMQTQEALHVSFVRRNQSHLAPPMPGLHCTRFLRHQYPSTSHHLFPTYPRTVRGPSILGGRDFTVPPQQPITQSRQRGAQTTSAHLHWCGADPPSSWPTHVVGHKSDPPKRYYIFAIFASFYTLSFIVVCILDTSLA